MRLAVRITFAGLLAYALIGWTWIDPAAGFIIAAFALREAKKPGKRTHLRRLTLNPD